MVLLVIAIKSLILVRSIILFDHIKCSSGFSFFSFYFFFVLCSTSYLIAEVCKWCNLFFLIFRLGCLPWPSLFYKFTRALFVMLVCLFQQFYALVEGWCDLSSLSAFMPSSEGMLFVRKTFFFCFFFLLFIKSYCPLDFFSWRKLIIDVSKVFWYWSSSFDLFYLLSRF